MAIYGIQYKNNMIFTVLLNVLKKLTHFQGKSNSVPDLLYMGRLDRKDVFLLNYQSNKIKVFCKHEKNKSLRMHL